jgi:TP901-1 family phage major tail protein
MAAQKGSDLLIKVDSNGSGTFLTIGGMRSKSISFNAETVDVTDSDSSGKWRELLEGGGIKSATLTGSGIFKDSASEEDVRGYFFAQTIVEYQFIIPDFGTVEGLFQVTSLDYAGEYNGEVTYSMTFESGGVLAWTADT